LVSVILLKSWSTYFLNFRAAWIPSSAGACLASRKVSLALFPAVDIESCVRFCPEIRTGSDAIKPEGVRAAVEDPFAWSLAKDCSRSALALSLFSSWYKLLEAHGVRGANTHYAPYLLWSRWCSDLLPWRPSWRSCRRFHNAVMFLELLISIWLSILWTRLKLVAKLQPRLVGKVRCRSNYWSHAKTACHIANPMPAIDLARFNLLRISRIVLP